MKLMKAKRAVIKRVEEYDISLSGDSSHYTTKSLKRENDIL
jgi:hypothetical protein